MFGTCANQHGETAYSEMQHVQNVFGGRMAEIVLQDQVPVNAAPGLATPGVQGI